MSQICSVLPSYPSLSSLGQSKNSPLGDHTSILIDVRLLQRDLSNKPIFRAHFFDDFSTDQLTNSLFGAGNEANTAYL